MTREDQENRGWMSQSTRDFGFGSKSTLDFGSKSRFGFSGQNKSGDGGGGMVERRDTCPSEGSIWYNINNVTG